MKVHAETRPITRPLPGGSRGTTVAVEPLLTGEVQVPRAFFERRGGRLAPLRMLGLGTPRSRWIWAPVPAFLVHHPGAGSFLVDAGLHPSVATKPAANLGQVVSRYSRPQIEPGGDLGSQLRARGVETRDVRLVVMTHLHFDHSSGMSQFPGATFVVTEGEWSAATTDRRPALRGYRPAHYDYAFDYRILSYDIEGIDSYASFGRTFDLFGDGSVRLASTPGHSAGHQSVICRLADRDLVIAGDAIYTMAQLEGGPEPPRPLDIRLWRRSLQELQIFHRNYPQAVIVPGHDPDAWRELEQRYA